MQATRATGRQRAQLRRRVPDILSYLVLVFMTCVAVVPLLWALSTSLKSESQVMAAPPQWIPGNPTLSNYGDVLNSDILRSLLNSLGVSVVVVAVTLLIAAHAGYAAARFRFRARSVLLFMILMTSMIPGIAILVPMYLLAVQVGVYNTYFGLALVYTAWQVPTVVWVLKAYFEAIPREIDDAARIDGCSEYRVFWQIVLPLARPGLAAAGLLVFVYVWNDFLIASTLVTSTDLRMVSVGLYNYLSTYGILWGPLMAATIIALLPVVVLFAATQRQFVEGLAAGAVKGAG